MIQEVTYCKLCKKPLKRISLCVEEKYHKTIIGIMTCRNLKCLEGNMVRISKKELMGWFK